MSSPKGFEELNKKLWALKGIKTTKAMLAGAQKLERVTKEDGNVPVDTGNLLSSIGSREASKGAETFASANYAYHVHEGTRFQAAQPFFTIAIDEHGNEIVEAVAKQIEAEIQKEAKK